ncbi:MAG: DinB family protein [Acidobacteria bacterium]|nr:DinB family protein [Acidobacteriota bacterium]
MQQVSAELQRIVDAAELVLRKVSEQESEKRALDGGWSRKQVIGHLIDSASNNHQRFVRASLQDSLDFPAYDADGCVRVAAVQEMPWPLLVSLWATYNRYLAHVIGHLPPEKLAVPCRIGANQPVTLRFLAEDYVVHMVHHLQQIGAAPPTP